MTSFIHWDEAFRNQNLFAFNQNKQGILYLKVRAVCRTNHIKRFLSQNNLNLVSTKIAEQFPELFALLEQRPDGVQKLDRFLQDSNNEWYKALGVDEETLKSGLRQIDTYEWGGDQNNSLDQYLIKRYVKDISNFNVLKGHTNEIATNAWKFVQTSWYNNWTSFLIESIFKKHKRVLSAVGAIKSVDFFIDNYPIDLKVTYFPTAYMQSKLKDKLGNTELTWIKRKAKEKGIYPDKSLSEVDQLIFLKEELSNHGHKDVINELHAQRKVIINEAMQHTEELIRWFYENQSARLFGAENRLFIVMLDTTDMNQSWKMKRAFTLIEPQVNKYIDNFNRDTLKTINFTFNKKTFTSLADIIFIVKE